MTSLKLLFRLIPVRVAALVFVAACVVAGWPRPVLAQTPAVVAYGISLTARPAGALLTLDLSEEVAYEVSLLTRPDRIVIDLPKVVFGAAPAKPTGRIGPATAFRYGLFFADRSRIVIDLAEPAIVERVDSSGADGRRRLTFNLARTDRAKFLAASEKLARERRPAEVPATASITPAASGGGSLPVVVIDPGHGGIDGGASGPGGESEKSIVLPLAHALRERLERQGKVRVAMTRTEDTFVSLSDRVKFAREHKAALMISLHADTVAYEPGVRGASIYTLSEKASDVLSAKLADSENKADQIAGIETQEDSSAIGDILFDLTKRETRHFSIGLARNLGATMPDSMKMHKNPLRAAGFRVLTAPDVPSVLIETGYLSSAEDAKLMKTAEWRAGMADAIARAVERFVGENATGVTNSATRP